MQNGRFTVFGLKKGEPEWAEELLIDTENENAYNRCLELAPKHGYKITRIYKPKTKLSAPNFADCVR